MLVFAGNAVSGGTVPFAFLPAGFRQVAPWLPNGAIVSAARDVTYLPASDLAHPLLVLAIWLAASLAVLAAVDLLHLAERRRHPGTASRHLRDTGYDTPAAAARPPAGGGARDRDRVEREAGMPSQAMQDAIDAIRDRQQASAGQAPPTLEERRAAFTPGDRLHPVPDDVLVTQVNAGGVPAHWLAAPGADTGRVLLFLHGGGFEFGSVRSDGELAARLGRASGMRVLFPEYRLAPEHPFPAAINDVLAVWRWLRTAQALGATINSGGRGLGRRRARRRPARGHA